MENMQNMQRKPGVASAIGHFFLAWVPMICVMAIQLIVSYAMLIAIMVKKMLPYGIHAWSVFGNPTVMQEIMKMYTEQLMNIMLLYQIEALLIFALWYYLYMGAKEIPKPSNIFTSKSILGIVVLGLSLEFFVSKILNFVERLFPSVMAEYQQLMEEMGLAETSVAVMLATVFLAPLVEELVFRGVTFQIAFKINHSFWLANILQALAFGIAHMNWVQGIYAFCLGIVMGCVYRKYRSIYATIILHAVFNFGGTILVSMYSMLPIAGYLITDVFATILALGGCYLGYRIIKSDSAGMQRI